MGDNGRLCAMKPYLQLERFPPTAGTKPGTTRTAGQCLTYGATMNTMNSKSLYGKNRKCKTLKLYIIYSALTLKAPSKIAADDTFIFFYFYLLKKIRLDVSCESSARQRIHMKYHLIFSEKQQKSIYQCRLLQS